MGRSVPTARHYPDRVLVRQQLTDMAGGYVFPSHPQFGCGAGQRPASACGDRWFPGGSLAAARSEPAGPGLWTSTPAAKSRALSSPTATLARSPGRQTAASPSRWPEVQVLIAAGYAVIAGGKEAAHELAGGVDQIRRPPGTSPSTSKMTMPHAGPGPRSSKAGNSCAATLAASAGIRQAVIAAMLLVPPSPARTAL